MEQILLLTKDAELRRELASLLPRGFRLVKGDAAAADAILFFDMDTLKASEIRSLRESHHVIAVTRQKRTEPVMEAATHGAYETLLRPVNKEHLAALLDELTAFREELKESVLITPPPPSAATCAIVGQSPIVMDVCKKLARLSQVEVPVLITGETGTGKELIAEAIAQLSSRFGKPFVVVNCAAVPETLLESELFGFEKGSFTGAVAAKEGMLKIAHEGCVFFDEVGELPLSIQAKLLRFIQTQTFYPLGSTREAQVDVRVLSATNRDLSSMVREGTFREDLYHRLRVASLHVPPLRERRKDIVPLVHFFLNRYRHTSQRPIKGVTRPFLKKLASHDWPGNIRELENTVRSAIALSKTEFLTTHELRELAPYTLPTQADTNEESLGGVIVPMVKDALARKEKRIFEKIHAAVDRPLFEYILSHARENQSEAARLLGINRLTLRKKIGVGR